MVTIAVTFVALLFVTVQGFKSECNVPSVETGQTAIVTCKFESDLKKHNHEFQVHRDCLRHARPQETILYCSWTGAKPTCHQHSRVTFDGRVTDQIQLWIHNVTKDDEGRYECLVLPYSGETNEDCVFAIKNAEMSTVKPEPEETTVDRDNANLSKDNDAFVTMKVLVGAVIGNDILIIFISVSLSLLIHYVIQKRHRAQIETSHMNYNKTDDGSTSEEKSEQNNEVKIDFARFPTSTPVEDECNEDNADFSESPLLNVNVRSKDEISMPSGTNTDSPTVVKESLIRTASTEDLVLSRRTSDVIEHRTQL